MKFSRSARVSAVLPLGVAGVTLLALALPGFAQLETETTTTTTTSSAPISQGSASGRSIVSQLRSSSPNRAIPTKKNLTSRQRAVQARRIARMTPAQRKKLVLKKYDIPPVGWLSSYLPADRYKFGKVWQYVSTETDKYYYRPSDMARRRFNANKVIGFRTWQLAMLAGYTPDPVTQPAPGAQILALAQYTTGPNFYRFVEYTYSGQVTPDQFVASYNYARKVTTALRSSKEGRKYVGNTLDRVFQAIVEGNPNLIPKTVGGPPPAPANLGGGPTGGAGDPTGGNPMGPTGAPSAPPNFPGPGGVGAPPSRMPMMPPRPPGR